MQKRWKNRLKELETEILEVAELERAAQEVIQEQIVAPVMILVMELEEVEQKAAREVIRVLAVNLMVVTQEEQEPEEAEQAVVQEEPEIQS